MPFTIDDYDTTTKVREPAVAPEPAPVAPDAPVAETPAPVAAEAPPVAAPRRRGISIDDYVAKDEAITPAVVEKKPAGEKGYGETFWDAVKIGVAANPDAAASFADWLGDDDDTDPTSIKNRAASFLRDAATTVKGGAEVQVGGVQDIHSIGDAVTFALESVGQGVGSTIPSIVGGAAGAGIGSVAGPGGTVVGGILGATGPAMVTGIGGTYDALRKDPELAKKLLDKEVTQAQLKTYAGVGGAMIGSLDAFGVKKMADIVGIKGLTKEIAEETIKKTILKAAKEGALAEGGTEALQQVVQSAFTALAGGSADLGQAALDALNAGIGGALGGGAMTGGTTAVTNTVSGRPVPVSEKETPESVDQETSAQPGASTPGGTGAPPPQPDARAAAPTIDDVVKVNPGVDPDAAAAARGDPVAPAAQTPPVTSVAEPTAQPVAPNVSRETIVEPRVPAEERTATDWGVEEDEDQVADPDLYDTPVQPGLTEKMKIRPDTPKAGEEIEIAAPNDDKVAALQAGKPEPIGTGQSPEPKPVTLNPLPGQTPPPGEPSAVAEPRAPIPQEKPPAPLGAEPGVGVTPAAAVPSAGVVPGVPAAPGAVGATPQVGPAGSEPVAQVLQTGRPSAAEAGMAQGLLAPNAEAVGGVRPAADIAGGSAVVQAPAASAVEALPPTVEGLQQEPAAVITSPVAEPAPALSRRAHDAAGQLRQIVSTALDADQYPREQIDAVTDEIMRGITPRLAASPDSVNAMIREFQGEAIAAARRRLPALAEELEREQAERGAEEIRTALERRAAQAKEQRAAGAPQQRARTTREGVKAAEDIEKEGALDEKPFERRAAKAVKEQGEQAPSYYRRGLEAITKRKTVKKGRAKKGSEEEQVREQAKAELAAARAEEVAARRAAEAEEIEQEKARAVPEKAQGTAQVSAKEQQKQAHKRKKMRMKAGLNKPVPDQLSQSIRDMPMPKIAEFGKPSWARDLKAAINTLLREHPPLNADGSPMTKQSLDAPPEKNFLVFAKNAMKTEDGLIDIATAKEFIDQGRMVDAANVMRDDDSASYGIGTTGMGEVTSRGDWDADEGSFEESGGDWGTDESVFALEGKSPSFTTFDENGNKVETKVDKEQVSSVGAELKRLAASSPEELSDILGTSVPKALRKQFVERLSKLVGDVPVYHVSNAEMMAAIPPKDQGRIRSPAGLYVRSEDGPGYILVNRDQTLEHEIYGDGLSPLHVMLHESTHAATAAAIDKDWNGSRKIFTRMYRWAQKQNPNSQEYGLAAQELNVGLHEFVAEAFSNLRFQEVLARTVLPETLSKDIKALSPTGKPTAWDMFVASVAHGLRMLGLGRKGMSMIEAVVRMAPTVMLSTHEQSARMAESLDADLERELNALGEPRGVADPLPLMRNIRGSHQALTDQKLNIGQRLRKAHHQWMQTSMGLGRLSKKLFGGETNPVTEVVEHLLKRDRASLELRKEGDAVAAEFAGYQKGHEKDAQAMADVLYDGTVAGIDPRLDVAANVAAGNVSAKGITDLYKREEIAKQHKAWNKLTPAAQDQANKLLGFYTKANADMANAQIEQVAKQMVDSGIPLPKGKTLADLIQWVKSRKVHNETGSSVRPRDQTDEDWHAALGGGAQTLGDLERSLHRKGIYVPLMREGEWVVSARENVVVPPNARRADDKLVPNVKDRSNLLVFDNEKDVAAYQKDAVRDGIEIQNVDSIWVDPQTGKRTTKANIRVIDVVENGKTVQKQIEPERKFVVHVNNRIVEFKDSFADAKRYADELRAEKVNGKDRYTVHDAQERERFFKSGMQEITPAHVTRLTNAIAQQSGGNEDMGRFMQAQVKIAALRTMGGNRPRHRNLKRQGVRGFNRDVLQAQLTYNVGHAHAMASLKEGNKAWDALKRAREYAKTKLTDVGGEVQQRQEIINELERRLSDQRWSSTSGENLIRQVTNWSAIVHLFSPAYSAINALQVPMLSFPVLSAKYGQGNFVKAYSQTIKEMGKVYAKIGPSLIARGIKETGKNFVKAYRGKASTFSAHDDLVRSYAGAKDGALLTKVFGYLRDMGLLDDAGIEQELTEYGKSWMTRRIHQTSLIARTMPNYIEALNRGVTAITSARMQKALDPTLSDEALMRRVANDVEETQFGYSSANMPTMFNSPMASMLLQFKKYPIAAGNLIGRNARKSFGAAGPERDEARKTFVRIAAMGFMMAGFAGIPGAELFKIAGLVASGLFGMDDWDDWLSTAQTKLGKYVGPGWAESIVRGGPRALNLDIAGRVGYDSMYLFGEPKKMDEANIGVWLLKSIMGPALNMGWDSFKAIREMKPENLPLPKVMKDSIKAYKKYQKGEFTGTEAATKAFGIQPGSASAPYETGPKRIGIKKAQEEKTGQAERTAAMNEWLNIPPGPKRNEARRAAMEKIKDYNKTVPRKDKIDRGDLARAEQRRKKKERQNVREAKRAA